MPIQVISFSCVLKNSCGQLLSSSFNNNVLTHSGPNAPTGTKLSALTKALVDLKEGESRRICLKAEQAYGYYDPKLSIRRSHDEIDMSGPVYIGDIVTFVSAKGNAQFRVTEVSPESISLDGNHPYAGQDLIFEIKILSARTATPEDMGGAVAPEAFTEAFCRNRSNTYCDPSVVWHA